MPHHLVAPLQRQNARHLRRAMTDVERKLWNALRREQLGGVAFRRQVPIGPYIVDFASHRARLVIELDGSQHNEPAGRAHDLARDDRIQREGYRVLRFWNHETNSEFDAVLDRIYMVLLEQGVPLETSGVAAAPHPDPPPQGGRGQLNDDRAMAVPSPLVGEGQGGG
ncbi:MAG: endonuclease domain-containing protein [Ancalomicrobiaceae bacterium]|nr:endonuclease domain-containing protein [Ancalomicrobiaceae bacterium]